MAPGFSQFLTAGLLLALAGCATRREPLVKDTTRTFSTVVVDAGHGGMDSGAVRRHAPPEKVMALDVAQRVDRKLRESQLHTVMTRASDVFVSLDRRVALQNAQKNSIAVSIHFNDSRRRRIHGFETYYHSPVAYSLARRIQNKLLTLPRAVNRGVHPANFRVLRNAVYPAVLVECGFLSNRAEARLARRSAYREQLADKIAEAIVEERYGPGVYHGAPQTAGTIAPNPAPPSGRTLPPGLINRF